MRCNKRKEKTKRKKLKKKRLENLDLDKDLSGIEKKELTQRDDFFLGAGSEEREKLLQKGRLFLLCLESGFNLILGKAEPVNQVSYRY